MNEKLSNPVLSSITTGKHKQPPLICIYGDHGIGKSTFASQFPRVIFIQTEDGLGEIQCTKFPLCKTFDEALTQANVLLTQEHQYKTVVVDSLDWLENLAHEHVTKKNNINSVADIPFGVGYAQALVLFNEFLEVLTRLRNEKRMIIVLLAHQKIEKYESPLCQPYDRFTLDLRDKVAARVMQWATCVSLLYLDTKVISADAGFREAKRSITGKRYLCSTSCAAYDAKNRYNMPEKIELDFKTYFNYFIKGE